MLALCLRVSHRRDRWRRGAGEHWAENTCTREKDTLYAKVGRSRGLVWRSRRWGCGRQLAGRDDLRFSDCNAGVVRSKRRRDWWEGELLQVADAWKPGDNVKKPRSRVVYAGHARGSSERSSEVMFDDLGSAKKGAMFDEDFTDE